MGAWPTFESTTTDTTAECKRRIASSGSRITSFDFTGLDVVGLVINSNAGVCEGGYLAAILQSGVDRYLQ